MGTSLSPLYTLDISRETRPAYLCLGMKTVGNGRRKTPPLLLSHFFIGNESSTVFLERIKKKGEKRHDVDIDINGNFSNADHQSFFSEKRSFIDLRTTPARPSKHPPIPSLEG